MPDLEIGYKTAKSRGTKIELISSTKISNSFAEACQSQKAMQADDGEVASSRSSPTAASGSQRCGARGKRRAEAAARHSQAARVHTDT